MQQCMIRRAVPIVPTLTSVGSLRRPMSPSFSFLPQNNTMSFTGLFADIIRELPPPTVDPTVQAPPPNSGHPNTLLIALPVRRRCVFLHAVISGTLAGLPGSNGNGSERDLAYSADTCTTLLRSSYISIQPDM